MHLLQSFQHKIHLTIVVLALCLSTNTVIVSSRTALDCNPKNAKMSCLIGCFGCFKAFGAELYDMASCCRDCRLSRAEMIDDGPRKCSPSHIRPSWLKRIG